MLDPVDVIGKLPDNFHELIESKKWLERKEALEAFHKLLTDNPRLCPKQSYGETVDLLKKVRLEQAASVTFHSSLRSTRNILAARKGREYQRPGDDGKMSHRRGERTSRQVRTLRSGGRANRVRALQREEAAATRPFGGVHRCDLLHNGISRSLAPCIAQIGLDVHRNL